MAGYGKARCGKARSGTAADKIFPWYVQQQIIEGWTYTVVTCVLAVAAVILLRHFKTANFDEGNGSAILAIIGAMLAGVVTLATAMTAPDTIGKIINPEYAAMRDLSRDVGRLVGK
jgi:hypothetical protein